MRIRVPALFLFAVLACSLESPKPDRVQAFIVIGAGQGIPLSGRSILFFDESILEHLSGLQRNYTTQLDGLRSKLLAADETMRSKVDLLQEDVDIAGQALVDALREEERKRINRDISRYKNMVSEMQRALGEYETIAGDLDAQFRKMEVNRHRSEAEAKRLVSETEKRINDYIIAKALSAPQVRLRYPGALSKTTSSLCEHYTAIRLPIRLTDKYRSCLTLSIEKEIPRALQPRVGKDMLRAYGLKEDSDSASDEIGKKQSSKKNALTPWRQKYTSRTAVSSKLAGATAAMASSTDELAEVDTEGFAENIRKTLSGKATRAIAEAQRQLGTARAELDLYSASILEEAAGELRAKLRAQILTGLVKNAVFSGMTDLDGSIEVPDGADYVYFEGTRMADEFYQWFEEIERSQRTFVLANHNISSREPHVGVWLFDRLP